MNRDRVAVTNQSVSLSTDCRHLSGTPGHRLTAVCAAATNEGAAPQGLAVSPYSNLVFN